MLGKKENMDLFLAIECLVAGFVLLIKGADMFVEGASNIAKLLKVPTIIIGLTVVAFGTSMPEASVSISSALAGQNALAISNVVGSNIFNTFVVIGVSAILTPLVVSKQMKKYDLPILMGIYLLLMLFSLILL